MAILQPAENLGGQGGYTFAASSDASSTFIHSQGGVIRYEQISAANIDGNFPAGSEDKNYFKCRLNYTVNETVVDWNVSGAGVASSVFNTFACVSAVVSSDDGATGLGTSGSIIYNQGYWTRLSTSADTNYNNTATYSEILIASPIGGNSEMSSLDGIAAAFILEINTAIRVGGLVYSTDSTREGITTTVPEPGWMPELLCAT